MCHVERLPNELLALIFNHVQQEYSEASGEYADYDSRDCQRDLCKCALVSRRWNQVASSQLYRKPQFRREQHLHQLLSTLSISSSHHINSSTTAKEPFSAVNVPKSCEPIVEFDSTHPYHQMIQRLSFNHFLSRAVTDQLLGEFIGRCSDSLRSLSLVNCTRLSDWSLMRLTSLMKLASLSIDDNPLRPRYSNSALLATLSNRNFARKLVHVEFYQCHQIDDRILMTLAVNSRSLQKLVILNAGELLTEKGIQALEEHSHQLSVLNLTSRHLCESALLHRLAGRCKIVYICVDEPDTFTDNDVNDVDGMEMFNGSSRLTRTRQCLLTKNLSQNIVDRRWLNLGGNYGVN